MVTAASVAVCVPTWNVEFLCLPMPLHCQTCGFREAKEQLIPVQHTVKRCCFWRSIVDFPAEIDSSCVCAGWRRCFVAGVTVHRLIAVCHDFSRLRVTDKVDWSAVAHHHLHRRHRSRQQPRPNAYTCIQEVQVSKEVDTRQVNLTNRNRQWLLVYNRRLLS